MIHLETVLKALKKNKSRDPCGWVNEIFMDGVLGENLKISLLHMVNKIRENNKIPDFVRLADVSTIYKGKGSKSELVNDRGIFIVSIIRSLLMRLVYLDYYSIIEKSMSDSQVGARKDKNIRNHIWIINGIISDVNSTKNKKPVDILIYDYKQCFDALWLKECMNDFYEAGLKDDKFALLYNCNKNVNIAVRTPVGRTERKSISEVITQGDVIAPMFCSKQVDTFGQECLDKGKYVYFYREEVPIPPLSMVDDLLCVSECGYKTTSLNAFVKFKTDSKKLQFGSKKCKKLHVGRQCEDFKCQNLTVDVWEEIEIYNNETGVEEIHDTLNGEQIIEDKSEEKYLGDVISTNGKNIKNIKARVSKGKGIVNRILTILEGIPLGNFYFEVAILLRSSLLVSSVLCNAEAWYNLTKSELNLLETIDVLFLRNLLRAPKCTPTEMLYLELGCIPFSQLIMKRRILFLHYILNQDKNSLLHKFLEAQIRSKKKKDWIAQVQGDLDKLNMNPNLDNLKEMKKSQLKIILERSIKEFAFKELKVKKESHSKVRDLKHKTYEMQKYLKPNGEKITQEEAKLIFKLRSKVTEVKQNFRGKYENVECELCHEEETQAHIMTCRELNKHENKEAIPEFEEIYKQNVKNQIKIARKFKENFRVRKNLLKL